MVLWNGQLSPAELQRRGSSGNSMFGSVLIGHKCVCRKAEPVLFCHRLPCVAGQYLSLCAHFLEMNALLYRSCPSSRITIGQPNVTPAVLSEFVFCRDRKHCGECKLVIDAADTHVPRWTRAGPKWKWIGFDTYRTHFIMYESPSAGEASDVVAKFSVWHESRCKTEITFCRTTWL